MSDGHPVLERAGIDPAVLTLRPDYRALLIVAEDLRPGPSDEVSDRLLAAAEATARDRLAGQPVAEHLPQHPHVMQWRAAFREFGAKPQRTRPSVEALLRRVPDGMPRVDRLTDAYNAVSVAHVLPVGGEDLDRYVGPPRLVRADGGEDFETSAGGEPVLEHPEPGEVVWRDDAGVTCRRWNWRQCTRTRLTGSTRNAIFILDALGALDDAALTAAGQALVDALRATSPAARTSHRLLAG